MLKLTGAQKGWFAIVVALWIIALAAMVFVLPKMSTNSSSPAPAAAGSESGSLASTLSNMVPPENDAVAAEMLDLRRVYGDEITAFVPVCSEEPKELIDAKLEAAGDLADQVDLDSGNNYMLLAKDPQAGVDSVDAVPSDVMDLCNQNYFDQFFSTEQGFPVYWDAGESIWRFGVRADQAPQAE